MHAATAAPKVKAKTPEIIAAIQSLRPGDYVELAL
jgi:hypothetical protein